MPPLVEKMLQVRSDFELDPDYVHLVGFWLSSHPRPVRAAIEMHRQQLDKNPYLYMRKNEERFDWEARHAIASFLAASAESISLTESATAGIGMVLAGLRLTSADDVLTTHHEHYSAATAAKLLTERTGARLVKAELYARYETDVEPSEIVARLMRHVSARTSMVLLTWVHSGSGVALPIPEICQALRTFSQSGRRPLVIVDITHAAGAIPIDLAASGVDIAIGSCHKWLLGPRGTAFVWGRPEAMDQVGAWIPSFAAGAIAEFVGASGERRLDSGERLSPGGFHCFEHRWSISTAIQYLEDIGKDCLFEHIRGLRFALTVGLSGISGVRVATPKNDRLSAGIVCFDVQGVTSGEACVRLQHQGILCSPAPYRDSVCRFSPFVYNSSADIERAIRGVQSVAEGLA